MSYRRALVVDGSTVSCKLAAMKISEATGASEVVTCGRGREALDHISQGCFDLITTALLLPDLDGLDLCKSIRQNSNHSRVPLIVISGDVNERQLNEVKLAGVTGFFDKSLGLQALGEFFKKFVRQPAKPSGRILYVEDSRTVATMTRRILEREGLDVVHTESGEEAVSLIESVYSGQVAEFDLVITDLNLSGKVSGKGLLEWIRNHVQLVEHELPVLIFTGNGDARTQVELFQAGANDIVNKPMIEETLLARVRSLLLIKQQHDALIRSGLRVGRQSTTLSA